MPLSWNEIRQRAIAFSRDWSDPGTASRERSEAQTFWNEFFEVFGVRRRTVAIFEEPVKNLRGRYDFIDLLWKGRLIAEHKSRGGDLSKAASQAFDYVQDLARQGRVEESPRYIVVSDFQRFAIHDLEAAVPAPGSSAIGNSASGNAGGTIEFTLDQFHKHIRSFAFIAGYETRRVDPEDPANFKAVVILGNLHDRLESAGFVGHDLQRFMVRILFCLFADDTAIFEPDAFRLFIENHTRTDGSDLGSQLIRLFDVLNTAQERRQKNLDEDLAALPYVNGELFAERLAFPDFNAAMRTALLTCCSFHWEKISPAIFGSLFQAIMTPIARRQIGAHYTSERDIMKVVRSLFLDDLRAEFDAVRRDNARSKKLEAFGRKLGGLKFLDPACGCGNFLVLAYRELRQLEMEVLQARFGEHPDEGDIRANSRVAVDQFYGIEIEEWPVRIAEVALWLMDHQMNAELFRRFGSQRPTVPLKSSPTIRQGNALRIDWNEVLPAGECSYVLGNPPFVGAKHVNADQKVDLEGVFEEIKDGGLLDYVCGWYFKAVGYIKGTSIRVGFVSTNSISQGEQVGSLWNELFKRGVKILFGHRTFAWESEARGKAHVHVVIIGFGTFDAKPKRIYDYETSEELAAVTEVGNISPYLIDGPDRAVINRSKPLCSVPGIGIGNKPIDDGNYLFTSEGKDAFIATEPDAAKFIRPFYGADDFLYGVPRYCLWLKDCPPATLRSMPEVMKRVEAVRKFRLASRSAPTQKLAATPTLFHVENTPADRYLLIPRHSSERRHYIPMGYLEASVLAGDSCLLMSHAEPYHFGILSIAMHMAWVRQVCGRLKSDYRYSNKLVYNNFPWPAEPGVKQTAAVESGAAAVLEAREKFRGQTLADLYDPVAMPPALVKAHGQLDRAVDLCYRPQAFDTERQRVEFLFGLYEKLVAPLTAPVRGPRKRGASK